MAAAKKVETKTSTSEPKDDAVKVSVRSAPLIKKEEAKPEPAAVTLTTHHELTIEPPKSAAVDATVVEADKQTAEPTAAEPEPPKPETPSPVPSTDPKPPTDDAPKQPTKAGMTDPAATKPLGATKPEEMQSPNVFDTTKYHLPIDDKGSSGSGKHFGMFLVIFLVIILVGGVLAIDIGWLDLGFSLPFDLIK